MSENEEKVQQDSQEPWDSSFTGSKTEQTSRVAHRRKTQQVRVIIGVLIAAVVALSMVPVIGYLQTLNQPTSQEQAWSKTMTSETKVTSFSSDTSKSKEKSESKQAESSSQKAQADSEKAQAASQKAADEQAASQKAADEQAASQRAQAASQKAADEQAASQRAQAASQKAADEQAASQRAQAASEKAEKEASEKDNEQKSVAVGPGQGAYRVATNAGISVAELRTLNPGVNVDNLSAGQMLRVK